MTERPKDNRAARRRDANRAMRALLERWAATDPRDWRVHEDGPCQHCDTTDWDHHDADCLWLVTREWLNAHSQSDSSSAPTRTSR